MIEWLTLKRIPFNIRMVKSQLYQLIKRCKEQYKTYKVNEFPQCEGHTVLRHPLYYSALNLIELIWATATTNLAARNINLRYSYNRGRRSFKKIEDSVVNVLLILKKNILNQKLTIVTVTTPSVPKKIKVDIISITKV